MRLLLVTLFLAQSFFYSTSAVRFAPSGRIVNCDDAEAHEAAGVAVDFINRGHTLGYKYGLNRIEDVKVLLSHANVEIFLLELDLLETKCPSVSQTPVEKCAVRPVIEQAVEGDCDVKLKKENGTFTVLGTRCKSELDSAENIQRICPNCPLLAPLNDTQVVHAVDVSLHKFNSGNNTKYYILHEIGRGQIQSGSSNTVNVEFVIAASNCSLEDVNADAGACVRHIGVGAHYGACSGQVIKHQGAVDEEVAVQCTVYEPQSLQDTQAGAQNVPLALPQPNVVHSHFHHKLHQTSLGPHSSESSSAEHHLLAAHAKHAGKRSLTGEPVPPKMPRIAFCPGRKIHF